NPSPTGDDRAGVGTSSRGPGAACLGHAGPRGDALHRPRTRRRRPARSPDPSVTSDLHGPRTRRGPVGYSAGGHPRPTCPLHGMTAPWVALAPRVRRVVGRGLTGLRSAPYLRRWIVLGALIGVVAGLGAALFLWMLHTGSHLLLGLVGGYTEATPA